MRKLNTFSISLLLIFFAFSFLHISNAPTHLQPVDKAVVFLEDWNIQTQWDIDKKTIGLQTLFINTSALLVVVLFLINFPRIFDKKLIFLIPIFHQSNYVILLSKL